MLKAVLNINEETGAGKEMKKSIVILVALSSIVLIAAIAPVYSFVGGYNWIAPLVKNQYDTFYGDTISVGYEAGSSASFYLNIINPTGNQIYNISAIKVLFDWGINYTDPNANYNSTVPQMVGNQSSHVFTVTIGLPDNTVASNLMLHSWTIYVEYVNAAGVVINTETLTGVRFAVFSSAQAEAQNLLAQIDQYSFNPPFLTSQAKQTLLQANLALHLGDTAYGKGDFTGAVSYYTNASSLIQSAYSSEYDKSLQFENALLGMAQGAVNMLNMMGIGYTLFGIGFFFMGIGVLVYLVRKSGGQRQQQAPPQ